MARKSKVKNIGDVNAVFANMQQAMRAEVLGQAANAGMIVIINEAKTIVHKISSTLARSLHNGPPIVSGTEVTVRGGTNVEYGGFEEFGTVFRPPHPYLRPAYADKRSEAVREVRASLVIIVRASAS